MLAGVGAGGAEVVGDVGLAVDGEGVALAGEALLDLRGLLALGRFFAFGFGFGVAVGEAVGVGVAITASVALASATATRILVPLGCPPRALPRVSSSAAVPRFTATLEVSESR